MNKYWFRAYRYGYGWYPASWQGGTVILIYFLNIIFGIAFYVKHLGNNLNAVIAYLPILILTTIMFFIIAVKTGEKARWRWGNRKE